MGVGVGMGVGVLPPMAYGILAESTSQAGSLQ